jgi:hypothetical protein
MGELSITIITVVAILLAVCVVLTLLAMRPRRTSNNRNDHSRRANEFVPPANTIDNPDEYFFIQASATDSSVHCGHGLGVFSKQNIATDSYFVIDKRLLNKLNDCMMPMIQTHADIDIAKWGFQTHTWQDYLHVSHQRRNCEIFLASDGRLILHTLKTVSNGEELLRTMDFEWLLMWHRRELKRIYEEYQKGELDIKHVWRQVGSTVNQISVTMLLEYSQNEKDGCKLALYDHLVKEYASKVQQDVNGDADFVQFFMLYM